MNIPDHPDVANALRSGWPSGREPAIPTCPVCGEETYETYSDGISTLGCPSCVHADYRDVDACPVCGTPFPELTYRDRAGRALGCDACVETERDD